ncbi:Senescence-induced receptor-like serine/threonine-protein kinase [Nymphaea thermarum]|nr:Senescence-induced receptor-like serine/threonine-protein kinase [Nymphaea thermarum]
MHQPSFGFVPTNGAAGLLAASCSLALRFLQELLCMLVGFLNIDCGLPTNSTYTSEINLDFVADSKFVNNGIIKQLPNINLPKICQTLRYFPDHKRNCYGLPVTQGTNYLVRASFMYGNYDGSNVAPSFKLYLGVDLWETVTLENATHKYWTEIFSSAVTGNMSVCLVNTSTGVPFISGLELRPLTGARGYTLNAASSLVTFQRVDVGGTEPVRYPDDQFDRIWSPGSAKYGTRISTNMALKLELNPRFYPPFAVMRTAVNSSSPIPITFSGNPDDSYHWVFYFAEILPPTGHRNLTIKLNGYDWSARPIALEYGDIMAHFTTSPQQYDQYSFTVEANTGSDYGPILNAYEVFRFVQPSGAATLPQDVAAIKAVKDYYKIEKNWNADPCLPTDAPWEGLSCNFDNPSSPRIESLDLSNCGLRGAVSSYLSQLTALRALDLSSNNLSGSIPSGLEEKAVNGERTLRYYSKSRLTEKSDVYSFGVVLFELITGQNAVLIQGSQRVHNIDFAMPKIMSGDVASIVDPRLQGQYDINSVWKVAETAIACTAEKGITRPTMTEIVRELGEAIDMETDHQLHSKRQSKELDSGLLSTGAALLDMDSFSHPSARNGIRETASDAADVHDNKLFWYLPSALPRLYSAPSYCPEGFLNIDCGLPANSTYKSEINLDYVADSKFIKNGIIKQLPNINLPKIYQTLRYFPDHKRNCYSLPVIQGTNYLVRASFMYGNYDGSNMAPSFKLYLGVDIWETVTLENATHMYWTEIFSSAVTGNMSVCLVNTSTGVPFISGLELRPLTGADGYKVNAASSLVTFQRIDVGGTEPARYPDDKYDRIWSPDSAKYGTRISTNMALKPELYPRFYPPFAVMRTAVNSSSPIPITFSGTIRLNGYDWSSWPIALEYRDIMAHFTTSPQQYDQYSFTVEANTGSDYGPILNAYEVFRFVQPSGAATLPQDVAAIKAVKDYYKIEKNWNADPCLPADAPWEGLSCNFDNASSPRIESLDLSNGGLSGAVASYLSQLTALRALDLSSNNLSGSIPSGLEQKAVNGELTLRIGNNPHLCQQDPCYQGKASSKKRNRIIIFSVVSSSVVAAIVVLLVVITVNSKRKLQDNKQERNSRASGKICTFTYDEVVEITNNFGRVIGKGGSCTVFYGQLRDGQEVAVKLMTGRFSQGIKEYTAEVELLMKVHHKCLVSFIGFCDEDQKMILIYEYMKKGDLQVLLSGLEYLHAGCRPPIIHRDVKTKNILLNEKLEAKIADFGLSKMRITEETSHVTTVVAGTPGYIDPELRSCGTGCCGALSKDENESDSVFGPDSIATAISFAISQLLPAVVSYGYTHQSTDKYRNRYYSKSRLTEKSDVYSFGVVLFELITGQNAVLIQGSQRVHNLDFAMPKIMSGDVASIVDPRLQGQYDINSVWKVAETAISCTAEKGITRPTMTEIVRELEEAIDMETDHQLHSKRQSKELDSGLLSTLGHGFFFSSFSKVELLMKVHHKYLASFVGFCDEDEKLILVYEYMERGNLRELLSALEYLHSGCRPPIVHRDVKTTNILLDSNLEAKLADFGLSKTGVKDDLTHMSTAVAGTPGYIDPEYYNTSKLTEKSDVYSFGVVLFELITGKHAIFTLGSDRVHILQWVTPKIVRGEIASIVDPRLQGSYDTVSMWKVADTALSCTADKAIARPTMTEVVNELMEARNIETHRVKRSPSSGSMPRSVSLSGGADLNLDSIVYPSAR